MSEDLDEPVDVDEDCLRDWPSTCGGTGHLVCDGCGGDFCICTCGGESECFGCPECPDADDYDELDDED